MEDPLDDHKKTRAGGCRRRGCEARIGGRYLALKRCSTTGIYDGTFLTILVRDDAGTIVAGLRGWTWGDCCEIKTLWVQAVA